MNQPSNKYWSQRADARMAVYHRSADATVNTITSAYDKGLQEINAEIDKIFNTFTKNGELSASEAAKLLNEPISKAEWDKIKAKIGMIKDPAIQRQMLSQLNAPAYAARITRLQALKANTYLQSKIIADAEIKASTAGYMSTIKDSYYRTMFDLQQGLGVGFGFAAMPSRTIETILKRPWSGRHFSGRVWDNTDVLASKLNEVLTAGFMSGIGTRKMSQELQETMNVGKHAANRLVRTETTYMANAAEMESYEEAEIDRYQFLATLDNRTSPQCQEHDGKVFSVKDAEPGKNMPPLHVFCRSTTIAYLGKETRANIQRRARDPVTGKSVLAPADMNYPEWRKSIEDKHGKERIESVEKQIRNKDADKKQFGRYKLIYGKNLTANSFAEFQNLKYNKGETWDNLASQKQKVLNSLDYKDSFYGLFGNKETREWYISHDKDIVNKIDRSLPLKDQAMQAHKLRNQYRTEARLMMRDRIVAEELNREKPNMGFKEQIADKMNRKSLTKEQAYQDVIETAGKTNKKVNKSLGLE